MAKFVGETMFALFALLLFTQVLLPVVLGRPMWPWFRFSTAADKAIAIAKRKAAEVDKEIEAARIEQEAQAKLRESGIHPAVTDTEVSTSDNKDAN